MYQLDQRICNLEVKLQDLEGSQGILEESLAYINRYLVEKNYFLIFFTFLFKIIIIM